MTTPNAALAYKVLDHIAANPDHFDMDEWSSGAAGAEEAVGIDDLTEPVGESECGTTVCLAGWVAALAGFKVDRSGFVWDGTLSVGDVESFAAGRLAISGDQAERLFWCRNDQVGAKVAEIFGPRPGGEGR